MEKVLNHIMFSMWLKSLKEFGRGQRMSVYLQKQKNGLYYYSSFKDFPIPTQP